MNAKKDPPKIRIPRKGRLVTKEQFIQVMRQLEPHLGIDIEIEGVQRAQSAPGGQFRFSQLPGGAAGSSDEIWSNFQPTFVDATHITVSNGSFNLTTPFIDTGGGTMVAINATTPPQLTVDASALQIVYLVVDTTLQTNASNYVTGFTLKSPTSSNLTIEAFSTAQTSTNTKRYIELFRWQAGALVNRSRYNNIGAQVRDDGTATGVPVWQTW